MDILTYESVSTLLANYKSSESYYYSNQHPFLSKFKLKYNKVTLSSNGPLSLPAVTDDLKGTSWDAEVGPKIHQLLPIPRSAAADRRLWTTLCHNQCYSHVRDRWLIKTGAKKGENSIKDRFFFEGAKRRNAIGMLWWTCERLKDDLNDDPYHYARPVLNTQRLTADLFERPSWSDNKQITLGALDAITSIFGPLDTLNTEYFRDYLKVMGYLIGQLPPDIFTRKEFSEIFITELQKFGQKRGHLTQP